MKNKLFLYTWLGTTKSIQNVVIIFFSERADPNFSENYKGRLKEGANINRSLVTLGNVIKALGKSAILHLMFLFVYCQLKQIL